MEITHRYLLFVIVLVWFFVNLFGVFVSVGIFFFVWVYFLLLGFYVLLVGLELFLDILWEFQNMVLKQTRTG